MASHAARYALGKKMNAELAALIRRIDKGAIVGRVFVYVFTKGQLTAQNAIDVRALRGPTPGAGPIRIRGYVFREGEVTFTGTIPGENVVGQTDARGGESETRVADRAQDIAHGSPAAKGGLQRWDVD